MGATRSTRLTESTDAVEEEALLAARTPRQERGPEHAEQVGRIVGDLARFQGGRILDESSRGTLADFLLTGPKRGREEPQGSGPNEDGRRRAVVDDRVLGPKTPEARGIAIPVEVAARLAACDRGWCSRRELAASTALRPTDAGV